MQQTISFEPTLGAGGRHAPPVSCLPCCSVDPYQTHTGMKSTWSPDLIACNERKGAQRGNVKLVRHTQRAHFCFNCSWLLLSSSVGTAPRASKTKHTFYLV